MEKKEILNTNGIVGKESSPFPRQMISGQCHQQSAAALREELTPGNTCAHAIHKEPMNSKNCFFKGDGTGLEQILLLLMLIVS